MLRTRMTVVVFLFSTALFALDSRVRVGDPEASAAGIRSYDISVDSGVMKILARDAHDTTVAEVATSSSMGVREIRVSLSDGSDAATLYWNVNTAKATIEELDGSRYEISMDSGGRIVGTDEAKAALSRHYEVLRLAASVVSDVGRDASAQPSSPTRFRVSPRMAIEPGGGLGYEQWAIGDWWSYYPYPFFDDQGGLGGSTSPVPICMGPTVRGWAFFLSDNPMSTRSAACGSAKADANLKCWNSACTGCCSFGDCDAYCILGDYVCVQAGITGTSCSVGG